MFRARGIPDPKSNHRLAEIRKNDLQPRRLVAGSSHVAAPSKLLVAIQGLTLAALMLIIPPPAVQDVSPPVEDIGALLLIVVCFDDLSQCRELPPPVSIFETDGGLRSATSELLRSLHRAD